MIKLAPWPRLAGIFALVFSFGAASTVRAETVSDSAPHLTDLRTDFRDKPLAV